MVAIAHTQYFHDFIPAPFYQSYTGVDLFFTISGFVVFSSIFKNIPIFLETENFVQRLIKSTRFLKTFFMKRVFRIIPLAIFWATVPLVFLSVILPNDHKLHLTFYQALSEFLSILSFQYNYAYYHEAIPMRLGYYWSLAVEEHFYLLLPFLLVLIPTKTSRLKFFVLACLIVAFIVRPLMPVSGTSEQIWHWYRWATHNRLDALFAGVILAMLRFELPAPEKSSGRVAKILLSYFAIFLLWMIPGAYLQSNGEMANISLISYLLASGLLVYLASFDNGYVLNLPGFNRLLVAIGERSYAIYLIHVPAYWFAEELIPILFTKLSLFNSIIFWIVLSGLLVELSYRLIEKPLIKFGRTFTAKI